MSVWLKRIFLALAALLALVVAVLGYLVATFDPNRYQGLIVDALRERYQRTLVIGESITLKVWPRLTLRLGGLKLSEHAGPGPFAAVQSADLVVDWLALLRRQVVVERVAARGVSLAWRRDAQGRSNIDDLLKPADAAAPAAAGPALGFDIGSASLEDVRVDLDDAQAGVAGVVELAALQVGRFASGHHTPVSLQAQARMVRPQVDAAVTGSLELNADLAQQRWAAQKIDLTVKGDLPGAQDLTLKLAGTAVAELQSHHYMAENLSIGIDARLAGLRLAGSTLSAASLAVQPVEQLFRLKDLAVQLKGTQGDAPLAMQLQWPGLQIKGPLLEGSALSGRFERGGPMALAGTFSSQPPSGSFEQLRLPQLKLKLQASGTRKVDADLRADVQVEPKASRVALRGLALEGRFEEPGLPPLALQAEGSAEADAKAAQASLKGRFNQDAFDAQVRAAFAGKVPQLDAKAQFAALDLDRLLPPAAPAAASAPGSGAAPIDLSALRSVNARIDLRVGQLARKPFRVGDLQLQGQLDGGVLRLARLAGQTWGGRFDLAGLVEAVANQPQRIALKGGAQDIDVNAALRELAGYADLEGRGRVNLDLATRGASVEQFKAGLAGNAALQLRDGALRGFNIARGLRQAKAALTLRKDEVQRARSTEKTDFSELSASFRIADGVATSNDLDAKSPLLRLGGDGRIDLPRGRLDYTVRASVANTLQGQDGADLGALKGLTVPVLLSGPFEAVDWKIQWSAVASAAATAAVKEKAQEQIDAAKAKLEDKLRDKLKLPAPAASGASAAPLAEQLREQAKDKVKDKLKGLFR